MKQPFFTRNFLLLLLGQLFSLIGNYTLKFALSMYVLERTGSAEIFGGILAISVIPTICLSPAGGVLADRVNRRWLMAGLDAVSGAAVLGCGIFLWGKSSLTAIAVLQVILGVLGALESPAVQACVPQLQQGDNLLRANALVNQVQSVAALITPFAGSLAYTVFGIGPVLVAVCGCFFLTAFLECWIHLPVTMPDSPLPPLTILRQDMQQSVHFLRKEQPVVLRLLLLAAAINFFAAGCITVGLPFLVRTELGLSAAWYGAAETVLGLAAVLGGVLVTWQTKLLRVSRMHWMLAAFGLALLLPAGILAEKVSAELTYGVLILAVGVSQVGCSIFSVQGLSAIQQRTPNHLTGKIMAFVMTISMCAQPVGQLLYGMLWDRLPAAVVLGITGSVLLTMACSSRTLFIRLEKANL